MLMFVRAMTAAMFAFTLTLGFPAPRAAAQNAVTVDDLLKAMTDTLTGA